MLTKCTIHFLHLTHQPRTFPAGLPPGYSRACMHTASLGCIPRLNSVSHHILHHMYRLYDYCRPSRKVRSTHTRPDTWTRCHTQRADTRPIQTRRAHSTGRTNWRKPHSSTEAIHRIPTRLPCRLYKLRSQHYCTLIRRSVSETGRWSEVSHGCSSRQSDWRASVQTVGCTFIRSILHYSPPQTHPAYGHRYCVLQAHGQKSNFTSIFAGSRKFDM